MQVRFVVLHENHVLDCVIWNFKGRIGQLFFLVFVGVHIWPWIYDSIEYHIEGRCSSSWVGHVLLVKPRYRWNLMKVCGVGMTRPCQQMERVMHQAFYSYGMGKKSLVGLYAK